MHLLRFKCKVTGRTFQEEKARGDKCSACALQGSEAELGDSEVEDALYNHCLNVRCIQRRTIFVEVKE